MLRLVYSNRFEPLVDALIESIRDERAADPAAVWAPAPIVVPNLQVASYVKLAVARATGIAAGMRFPFLESFVIGALPAGAASDDDNSTVRLADKGRLHAALCRALADPVLLADAELAPVRAWLDALPPRAMADRDARDLRRFQLAGELATRFLDYAAARPALIAGWPDGLGLADTAWAEVERWQRRLFLAVLGPTAPWRTAPQLAVAVTARGPLTGGATATRAHVIGFSWLPPAYLRALAALGRGGHDVELTIYALNPCGEFWEDVPGAGRGRRRGAAAIAAAAADNADASAADPADENALLRLWGGPGRDHFRALNELGDGDFVDRFVDPADAAPAGAPTLLAELQRDVLRRTGERARAARPLRAADDSVCVLACPGITRELEIIGEEIWTRLRADPTLACDDIAVLINRGQLGRYQPHVAAVFGELHELPHHLVEVPLAAESRIAEAVDLLLDLPFGRFTRPELLRLLVHPAVLARYPHIDPADWVAWTDRLGIVHGADEGDHAGTYVDGEHFHWRQGLRRLALGAFMAGPRSGLERAASFGNLEYLPEELPRDALPSAALLSLLARSLIEDARFCRSARLPLAGWQRFFDRFVETYLTPAPGNDDDARSLRRCREAIAQLADMDPPRPHGERDSAADGDGDPAVSYRIARELVGERLAALRGDSGELYAGGVIVAPVLPMRPIPFRLIFVAGLGEGLFPAAEVAGPLDLRAARPQPGDVGPRDRDRYAFLETVLAARDRLYLSYVARDEQTGDALEPSSVVVELLDQLRPRLESRGAGDPAAALVRRHPLRRWDGERAGPEHAPAARRQRRAVALRADLERHLASRGVAMPDGELLRSALAGLGVGRSAEAVHATLALHGGAPLPPRPAPAAAVTVTLGNLRSFLDSPVQAWAKQVLRLREVDDDDPVARQDEPLALDVLQSTGLLRDVFLRWLSAPARGLDAVYDERIKLLRGSGAAPVGVFGELDERHHLAVLRAWQTQLGRAGAAIGASGATGASATGAGEVAAIGFGRGDRGQRARLQPPLALTVDVDGNRVEVELVGATSPLAAGPGLTSLVLVAGGEAKLKHAMRGALDQLVLAAAGIAADAPHTTLVLTPAEPRQHQHAPWSRDEASAHLRLLIGELLAGSHAYLLPIDAIDAWRKDGDPASLAREVGRLRANQRNGAWSGPEGYGPLSAGSGLDAPDDGAAIAARRFAPFFTRASNLGDESGEGADE